MSKFIREVLPYILIVILVVLIRTYIVTPVTVDGPSMNNTLYHGDVMILNKFDKNYNQNDIVVFNYSNEKLIKRVIATPGQKVKCVSGVIYINNEEYEDVHATGKTSDFQEVTLGDEEYFVLGDNRENSLDSRVFGPIKKNKIMGKTRVIIFPFDHIKKL